VFGPLGLAIKSNAPSRRACIVTSAPRLVCALTMMTPTAASGDRVAFRRWMPRRVSRPFIPGISTSNVTTSGGVAWTNSNALWPLKTEPTTSIPSWPARDASRALRKIRESSTISTLAGDGMAAFHFLNTGSGVVFAQRRTTWKTLRPKTTPDLACSICTVFAQFCTTGT
jgi:hypothetical protein